MTSTPERVTLASRGSKLALAQADLVADMLRAAGVEVAIEIVSTRGDADLRPFAQIGGKGLFTSEIERAVLEGAADVAVHSAKDLTADLAPGCVIASVPTRTDPRDVVVGGDGDTGEQRLASLPAGARVGTSSARRRALLAEMRPDLRAVELRGNLDTRLRKVAEGEVDAAILAAAGLRRFPGPVADAGAPLDPSRWVPAPAQGALALEIEATRADLAALLASIDDPTAAAEVRLERAFARALEGGCTVPLGCLARLRDGALVADGFLGSPDGRATMRDRISGSPREAEALGAELAGAILGGGGDDLLEDIRAAEVPAVPEP